MVGPGHCPMNSKYGPSLCKAVDPSFLVVKKSHFRTLTPLFGNGAGAHGIGKISGVLTEIGKFDIEYDVSIARSIPISKLILVYYHGLQSLPPSPKRAERKGRRRPFREAGSGHKQWNTVSCVDTFSIISKFSAQNSKI